MDAREQHVDEEALLDMVQLSAPELSPRVRLRNLRVDQQIAIRGAADPEAIFWRGKKAGTQKKKKKQLSHQLRAPLH